ncbi:MAG TPA: PAS domain-containing protein [Spirochaetia bacterium]
MSERAPVPRPGISPADQAILKRYEPIAEAIAVVCGQHCEVVLHSLHDLRHSVVKIVNSHVTGRSVGAPVTDFGLEILERSKLGDSDVIGPYFTTSFGKTLRSMTMIIRNARRVPIGFLCVNMDLSTPLIDVLGGLLPNRAPSASESVERFPTSLDELIDQALATMRGLEAGPERNKKIIQGLYEKGIFNLKGSVEDVAAKLGISMHTIYYHLGTGKKKPKRSGH